MIKRVAVCESCGVERVLESDTAKAPNGWWQVTHVHDRPQTFADPVTSIEIFCERACAIDWLKQQVSRET